MISARFAAGLIVSILVAIACYALHQAGYKRGYQDANDEWTAKQTKQLQEHTKELELARQKELNLQASADQLKVEKDREITRLNANVDRLVEQLRKRPARPAATASGVPETASTGTTQQGFDGRGLYDSDSIFLVRYFNLAAKTQLELKSCRAAYDKARKELGSGNVP